MKKVLNFDRFAQPHWSRIESKLYIMLSKVVCQREHLEFQLLYDVITDVQDPFFECQWNVLIVKKEGLISHQLKMLKLY